MQINISGHQLEVTPALHEYVTNKLNRLARRLDNITTIHITLSIEKQKQVAEANVHVAGANFSAKSDHADMYAAIDLLIDKLNRQLRKHKEKNVDRQQGATTR